MSNEVPERRRAASLATSKQQQSKNPQAPSPFLPERLERESPDQPDGWSDVSPSVWLFPLNWFLSDVEEFDLTASRVRRLTDNDLGTMISAEKRYRLFGDESVPLPILSGQRWSDFRDRELPWVIEMLMPADRFRNSAGMAHFIRRSVEAALRIVSHRYVSAPSPVVFQPNIEDSLSGEYALTRSDFPDIPMTLKYHLAEAHVPLLQTVHGAALNINQDRVRVAMRRFLLGYGRGDDDSIIDLWIGLEALFGDKGGEITYKAAMRIANYTGYGSYLFRDLLRSYKVRSALVHGAHPANTKVARQTARDALRFSLLKLLNQGAAPNINELDNSIAAGAAR